MIVFPLFYNLFIGMIRDIDSGIQFRVVANKI